MPLFACLRRPQSSRHTPCAVSSIRRRRNSRRIFFEPLEHRLVLTGITASLTGDQLVVTGTDQDDTILIDQLGAAGAEVRVMDNGNVAFTFAGSAVASAYVSAREGHDSVTIDASFGARPISLQGDAGNDALTSSGGNDTLTGGSGADTYDAGGGNDLVYADAADASAGPLLKILGGAGVDLLNFSAETTTGVVFNNSSPGISGEFETIYGSSQNDNITSAGAATAVSIYGFGGADLLVGGSGNDYLEGGEGNDAHWQRRRRRPPGRSRLRHLRRRQRH
jgi:Ca2+-binding RTX toxin-like protein